MDEPEVMQPRTCGHRHRAPITDALRRLEVTRLFALAAPSDGAGLPEGGR